MEVLEFIFKNKVGENGRDHNVSLCGKLINKVKTFKHMIVQENGGIAEDVFD